MFNQIWRLRRQVFIILGVSLVLAVIWFVRTPDNISNTVLRFPIVVQRNGSHNSGGIESTDTPATTDYFTSTTSRTQRGDTGEAGENFATTTYVTSSTPTGQEWRGEDGQNARSEAEIDWSDEEDEGGEFDNSSTTGDQKEQEQGQGQEQEQEQNQLESGLVVSDQKDNTTGQQCVERTNFVFVKTHKTGTSTTVNIWYYFGMLRGLNFAVYPYTHYLYYIKPKQLMKLEEGQHYNIMCQHMFFNRKNAEEVMPADSYYTSLLREPVSAYISNHIFYGSDGHINSNNGGNLTLDQTINIYLDAREETEEGTYIVGGGLNKMSEDLGLRLPNGKFVTENVTREYIEELDERFEHVFILEKLDESLMLFREDMCWKMEDLFYLSRMKTATNRSKEGISEETRERIMKASVPDSMLYKWFKEKLERRLAAKGPEFSAEVEEFRKRRKEFEEGCLDVESWIAGPYASIQHPLLKSAMKDMHCRTLMQADITLTKLVSYLQDPNYKEADKEEIPSKHVFGHFANFDPFPRQDRVVYGRDA